MNDTQHEHPILEEINYNIFYQPTPGWGERTIITRRPRGEMTETYTLSQWQEMGYDTESIVLEEDPFVDLENDDFRVRQDSPALKMGFKNFDMSWGITDEFPKMWR
jgi:hypothetical protein